MHFPIHSTSGISLFLGLLGIVSDEASAGSVRINEFMAVNVDTVEDKDGDFSDWIELYNDSEETLSLDGWFLTDDAENLRKWRIPGSARIGGGDYLLVFASGKDFSSIFSADLHTNFKLSGAGEYLALIDPDGEVASEVNPAYPEQLPGMSYGYAPEAGEMGFLLSPTPKAVNSAGADPASAPAGVRFSRDRGYCDGPFLLELSTATPDAKIRYTTTGAKPTLFTSKEYRGPIEISKTTTIRAQAEKPGYPPSSLVTHTYIFPEEILDQQTMSASVIRSRSREEMIAALTSLPALSIRVGKTIGTGAEDPALMEFLPRDGSKGFEVGAGVKRVGGASINHPKNNIRVYFSSRFGDAKLKYPLFEEDLYARGEAAEEFDRLQLHGGSHDSVFYLGSNQQPPSDAQYLRNRWMSDTQFVMGRMSLRGIWVQVYIDHVYWGFYQLQERPHPSYFASYLGGSAADHMATNRGSPVGSSDMRPWAEMKSLAGDWEEFQARVDIGNYVDYMLLNYYAGNDWDWSDQHNWMAGGPVRPGAGGFKFFSWDSDIIFRRLEDNNTGRGGPEGLFPRLMRHPDFRVLVADRIYEHFYNDGILTPARVAARYNARADEIRAAVLTESARWGGGRWTRESGWEDELERLNEEFFPRRTEIVVDQFRARDYFREGIIPRFSQSGGEVGPDFELRIAKSLFAGGTIYYTLDGSDPRASGGAIASSALRYESPIILARSGPVHARTFDPGSPGEWSALARADFLVGAVYPTGANTVVSRINYRPAPPDEAEVDEEDLGRNDFEFIELMNIGAETVDLRGAAFVDGVEFDFAAAPVTRLAPGGTILLVGNADAFAARYGEGHSVAGVYSGRLANEGERIRLENAAGEVILDFRYGTVDPWPEEASGSGKFLVLRNPETNPDPSEPGSWSVGGKDFLPGSEFGGMTLAAWKADSFPGRENDAAVAGDLADPDRDGYPNVVEYAGGSDPNAAGSRPRMKIVPGRAEFVCEIARRAEIDRAVSVGLEESLDLRHWSEVSSAQVETRPGVPGMEVLRFRAPAGPARARYVRVKVTVAAP